MVAFAVPESLREHAPAAEAAICTACLATCPAEAAGTTASSSPAFDAVDPAFPDGEAGVALALACGLLESFALNRRSIEALVTHAERAGADAFLFFDRLDAAAAAFDLDRRRAAIEDVL